MRRRRGDNAPFVRDLLLRLEAIGFDVVPRWLGSDDHDREIFSFIAGDVPLDLGLFDDAVLIEAARLIRRFHDATARLRSDGRIVCHNDLSPCNFVFRDGAPVAIIDFDLAAPGERSFDLGYAAWLWLDLGNEEIPPADQRRRLALFVAAYDPEISTAEILDAALLRQQLLIDRHFGPASDCTVQWARQCREVTLALSHELNGQTTSFNE